MLVGIILTACLFFARTNGVGFEFNYEEQMQWQGVCVSGNTGRQSPIDIETASVRVNAELTDLRLGDGWTTPITGTFKNGGHNVQFDPTNSSDPAVLTTNYLGQYRVLQMHMHWGADDQEGSEHTINGNSYPLELHFVHEKVGTPNSTIGDTNAVIGVFAEADDSMAISGVWAQLNISAVQSYPSSVAVSDFIYRSLLPSSLDYYHYPGSLTTPGCDEVVQWFVLKETISVPSAYLAYLRQIESANNGTILNLNFRALQPLGQRTVETPGSGSPKIVASAVAILVAMIVTVYFS